MKTSEALDMQGCLTLQLCDAAGRMIHRQSAPNHIVLSGRDLVARMFVLGDLKPISHLAVGKGIQAVTASDTKLATEIARVPIKPLQLDRDLLEISTEDGKDKRKKVVIHAELGYAQGNETLTEAALFNQNGIMYNRIVFAPVQKTQDFVLTLIWEITF